MVQTTSALEGVRKILELIRVLVARFPTVNADLQNQMYEFVVDLKRFEKRIGCLRILPNDQKLGKA